MDNFDRPKLKNIDRYYTVCRNPIIWMLQKKESGGDISVLSSTQPLGQGDPQVGDLRLVLMDQERMQSVQE